MPLPGASVLRQCRIAGMGGYLPDRVVTNHDLTTLFDTSDEWIVQRTGIRERRFAPDGVGTAEMGARAARVALEDAGWTTADVDFVVFVTITPDHFFPGSGCYLQQLLGLRDVGALDIRNQCSGFLYGLTVASSLIGTEQYRRILLVCAEKHSAVLAQSGAPRHIAVLFGDGAAALALEAGDEPGLVASVLHADGAGADALKLELFDCRRTPYITTADLAAGSHFPVMDGRLVYTKAVECMVDAAHEVLAKAGLPLDVIDLVIPHQANLRISEKVRQKLGLGPERVFNNIETVGNTTSASIPLAMAEARGRNLVSPGNLLLLLAFGSGFTWGGAVVRL